MILRPAGFVSGIVVFLGIQVVPVPEAFLDTARDLVSGQSALVDPILLAESMQRVLAVTALMVVWWLTEAVPLAATALLPALLFPVLQITGLQSGHPVSLELRQVLPSYASPVIFLFLGGFLIATAMQKWGLDRRFTLWLLTRGRIAEDSRAVLLGIMTVTALLSMWISNTATAAMMLPLGLGILRLMNAEPGESTYARALMLGIAWAASIGGVGTVIGSPPNGIALGILDQTLREHPDFTRITFLDWMKFGVPMVLVFLPLAWFIILRLNPPELKRIPGGKARLEADRAALGPISAGEWRIIFIFAAAVLSWISNPFWDRVLPAGLAAQLAWIDEYAIGLFFGVLAFFMPVHLRRGQFALEWKDARNVDWGTLILFGGGIALSQGLFATGLASCLASGLIGLLGSPSTLLMAVVLVLFVELLTEITSNTAVTSMVVPIVVSIAITTGADPVTLALASALAASMAFMLPVATPPNALVFGSGYVRMSDMIRTGVLLELCGWGLTVGILYFVAGKLFGLIEF